MMFEFIPIPFYDKEDGQWKPSVKTLLDGNFYRWEVFDLGFDEPKYTMPYAIELAKEIRDITNDTIASFAGRFI